MNCRSNDRGIKTSDANFSVHDIQRRLLPLIFFTHLNFRDHQIKHASVQNRIFYSAVRAFDICEDEPKTWFILIPDALDVSFSSA